MKSLKNLANLRKMIPQKYFPVFARVRIQAPHVFAQKLIPQEFFPACIGFVPGGTPAKASRDKWELYRDTNWGCMHYFLPKRGQTFAKVSRWKCEMYRDTFWSIGVSDRSDSSDKAACSPSVRSRHLLATSLLRTPLERILLGNLPYCKSL